MRTWVCLGEIDEWHPFCPFATVDAEKAREHDLLPGHWVVDDVPPQGMWAQSLKAEAEKAA